MMKVLVAVMMIGCAGPWGWAQERMTPEQEAAARRMLSGGRAERAAEEPVRSIPPAVVEPAPVVVEPVPVAAPVLKEDGSQAARMFRDQKRLEQIRELEAEMERVVQSREEKARKQRERQDRKRLTEPEAEGARAVMEELNRIEEERFQPRGTVVAPANPGPSAGPFKAGPQVNPLAASEAVLKKRQERLAGLEALKGTLSEEEYRTRRIQILLDELP